MVAYWITQASLKETTFRIMLAGLPRDVWVKIVSEIIVKVGWLGDYFIL